MEDVPSGVQLKNKELPSEETDRFSEDTAGNGAGAGTGSVDGATDGSVDGTVACGASDAGTVWVVVLEVNFPFSNT